jgi:hypothetical protein
MTSEQLCYENRVVAYCDILGWSDATEQPTDDSAILRRLTFAMRCVASSAQLLDVLRGGAGETPYGLEITHFSDSVAFSCPANDSQQFATIAMRVNELACGLLTEGQLLTRGAMVVGKLYHRQNIVFGPALVKAYKLESQYARYPRILVAEDVLAMAHADGKGLDLQKVKRDVDGLYYLDSLRVFAPPTAMLTAGVYPPEFEFHLRRCREVTVESLERYNSDLRKQEKWQWIAQYFNEVVNEYPMLGIESIPL